MPSNGALESLKADDAPADTSAQASARPGATGPIASAPSTHGHCVPHAHDRLTAGVKLARQGRHSYSVHEPALDSPTLVIREAQGPAEHLAFSFHSAQTSLGTLDQQVPLELRDGVED